MKSCPVCKRKLKNEERFCPECAWEFKVFLGEISDEEKTIYSQRLEIARKLWEKRNPPKTIKSKKTAKNTKSRQLASKQNDLKNCNDYSIEGLKRDPFETFEEFEERIKKLGFLIAGEATLLKERYDIETGRFPIEIKWDKRLAQDGAIHLKIPQKTSNLFISAERDSAKELYSSGKLQKIYMRIIANKNNIKIQDIFIGNKNNQFKIEGLNYDIPKAGDSWIEPFSGATFLWIPSGTFQMGDIFGNGYEDEKPPHKVRLSGFWITKTPITQIQWINVMQYNPSFFKPNENFPIENISWHEANKFINKINSLNENLFQFSLPSEAQWEYAARSGGKREKFSGGEEIDAFAWYEENSGGSPHRVGMKHSNQLGLQDMSGNVREWCLDVYKEKAYKDHSLANPVCTGNAKTVFSKSGASRINRGGSWQTSSRFCRTSDRRNNPPNFKSNDLGLRLVRLD